MAKRYGIPYKGSKSQIADKIFELFPPAENFYDLFAGGCAMTHFALAHKHYKKIILNDINPMPLQLFHDAIDGKYKNENRWISREDFSELKDKDPYIRYCWSFGNNGENYLYAKELEPWKKALHFARVLNDFSLLKDMGIDTDCASSVWVLKHQSECKQKYIAWLKNNLQEHLTENPACEIPLLGERLETLERLQNLESLQSLQSLQWANGDYSAVEIVPNSIIYCDIPYQDTDEYDNQSFDYTRFFDWCAKQTVPLFISSYDMPQDRFVCIREIMHKSLLCATSNHDIVEKVFIPKHQAKNYTLPGSLFNYDEI